MGGAAGAPRSTSRRPLTPSSSSARPLHRARCRSGRARVQRRAHVRGGEAASRAPTRAARADIPSPPSTTSRRSACTGRRVVLEGSNRADGAPPIGDRMKALVYDGPRSVSVTDVPDPRIERPTDAIVRITATNICGSDLHMYEGRTDMETGRVLGHENLGEVVEVGEACDVVKVGDFVVLPFSIACGHCANCERGLTAFCLI